jgi:hypothetical protein
MRHRSEDDVGRNTTVVPKSSAATIQERKRDDGDSKKRPTPTSSKEVEDKEAELENISSVTSTALPGSKSGRKRLQDYSAFGQGRYAKDLQS